MEKKVTLAHRLGQPGLEFRPTSIQLKGKISGALARKRYQQGHLEVFADLATNQKAGSSNLSGLATLILTPLARHTVLICRVLLTLAVLCKSLTCKTNFYD